MYKRRQLKNYLLFPWIQFKFLIFTIASILVTVGLSFYQLHSSFSYLIDIGKRMGLPKDAPYFKLLEAQEALIIKNTMIGVGVALVISIIINFLITHRALGPFYRLKVFFKNYKKGSGERIKFREKDYFKDLENDINNALD
jgi:hypothetical protein